MRIKPRRETRGVSRSKCGDLITATVPVSWATSIIVNESTDAIDYYDGFGTTELVVGIRAYQWGWEYYYPKDIDLNYNIKPNYSIFAGNSLKYNKTTDINIHSNNLWKFYQNKNNDLIVTPAHLLVSPLDNFSLINFFNFNDIGSNPLIESNAFQKIKTFSKTYTSNLNYIPNNFSLKYKKISNSYINDNFVYDSYLYGLKKQHNFLSNFSIFNNQNTFFNLNSINKFYLYNFNYDKSNNNLFTNNNFFSFKNIFEDNKKINIFLFFDKLQFNTLSDLNDFKNFFLFSNFLKVINNNSDKKRINNVLNINFNNLLKGNISINNFSNINVLNNALEINYLKKNTEIDNLFLNNNNFYRIFSIFSNNQNVLTSNKNIRTFLSIKPQHTLINYSLELNNINEKLNSINFNTINNYSYYLNSKNKWSSYKTVSKLLPTRLSYDYPYSPILSNNFYTNFLNYDSQKLTSISGVPTIYQGKEELMPLFLPNSYWNFYFSNSNLFSRIYNIVNVNKTNSSFYLPIFNFYYDYDFRNWQSLEMLEDSFWESNYSIYNHDEYVSLKSDFCKNENFDNLSKIFNIDNRLFNFDKNLLNISFFKSNLISNNYTNYIYSDDFVVNPNNLLKKNFFIFPTNSLFYFSEENFENFKNYEYLVSYFNNQNINISSLFLSAHSFLNNLDPFRSDYEDFSWHFDENNYDSKILNNISDLDLDNFSLLLDDYLNFFLFNDEFFLKSSRFNNNINLRNTAKNSIVTYNAIQKVFKTRFDEGRSHSKLSDFSGSFSKQPFISSERVFFEKLLGKNKKSFFDIVYYKNNFKKLINTDYSSISSLNFYFFDFPFLLATKSDSSRYLWFDWFAKWGYYEVQPSSASRYAIHGMPYFSKNFEFTTNNNELLNESENYFIRISKSRRNYLPNWTYTPYFFNKNNFWFKNNIIFNSLSESENPLESSFFILENMSWYWKKKFFINFNQFKFIPSNSNISSYSRISSKSNSSIQSYYYSLSNLIDILTKREFMYREYFFKNNKIVNLPTYLTSNPKNPLLLEFKNIFKFIDPISVSNEYSRDLYYYSLNFFNFRIFKPLFSDNFNFYFSNLLGKDFNNFEIYKNQYRPMKKGITNMVRLHATGAIALPIEIRLQVLASSKDVIHSWAIPSAGIKIDCVPGYSSHRVMIFLVSGIYWGQCMEICGRYHHWMPIVVYFMKRDLFFLWCTHFIFLSGNNVLTTNDKQYLDYSRLVSFDKTSWLTELNY